MISSREKFIALSGSISETQASEIERQIILAIGESDDPPTELMLFAKGLNETTKGPVVCDEKACAEVMSRFKKRGLDKLPFDYGHGMVYGTDSRASAWFVPKGRDGALWATQIKWTPSALQALKDREYRFYSPFCMVGYEDGRLLELLNVALVCMPATNNQKAIVASALGSDIQPESRVKPEVKKMDPELARLLGILGCVAVGDVEPKIKALGTAHATALASITTLTAQNTTLASQVAALSTEAENGKRDALIVTLSTAGKLPPALHAWAKTQSYAVLESFGASAPVIASSAPVTAKSPEGPPAVTPDANEVLKQFGFTSRAEEFSQMNEFLSKNNGVFIPSEFPFKKGAVS